MGDRANIAVKNGSSRVYLYTHWNGSSLPQVASAGLDAGRGRWNDPAYLTRIVFCRMVAGNEMNETGFGISTSICDNEYPILVIDCDRKVVLFEDLEDRIYGYKQAIGAEFTFEEYVKIFEGVEVSSATDYWQMIVDAKQAKLAA